MRIFYLPRLYLSPYHAGPQELAKQEQEQDQAQGELQRVDRWMPPLGVPMHKTHGTSLPGPGADRPRPWTSTMAAVM